METTIDAAGRLVVPKALRERLGLTPGMRVDLAFVDGHIELSIAPIAAHLERRGKLSVITPDEEVPPLTEGMVRATLEATRR